MFQSWWDVNKQIVRKMIDTFAGLVGGWLLTKGEWGAAMVPAVALIGNFIWFWIDNKSKATVKGLAEAGMSNAAIALEDAIVVEKAKTGK